MARQRDRFERSAHYGGRFECQAIQTDAPYTPLFQCVFFFLLCCFLVDLRFYTFTLLLLQDYCCLVQMTAHPLLIPLQPAHMQSFLSFFFWNGLEVFLEDGFFMFHSRHRTVFKQLQPFNPFVLHGLYTYQY